MPALAVVDDEDEDNGDADADRGEEAATAGSGSGTARASATTGVRPAEPPAPLRRRPSFQTRSRPFVLNRSTASSTLLLLTGDAVANSVVITRTDASGGLEHNRVAI